MTNKNNKQTKSQPRESNVKNIPTMIDLNALKRKTDRTAAIATNAYAMAQKRKQNSNNNKKQKTGSIDGFITRALTQFQITMSDPLLLIMLAVIFFAAYSHHYHVDQSVVKKIVKSLKEQSSTKAFGEWLEENIPKAFGIAISMALCTTFNEKHRYTSMIASAIGIIMLPVASITFYAITAASIMLYMKMKRKSDKLIVAILIGAAYMYFFLAEEPVKTIAEVTPDAAKTNTTTSGNTDKH